MTLTEFLLARIAEEAAVARAAHRYGTPEVPTGAHWRWVVSYDDTPAEPDVEFWGRPGSDEGASLYLGTVETHPYVNIPGEGPDILLSADEVSSGVGAHIVRWDPARVLAECEAKRRIVEEHGAKGELHRYCQTCGGTDYPVDWPCDTLRLLALPYASHPDYDPAWQL